MPHESLASTALEETHAPTGPSRDEAGRFIALRPIVPADQPFLLAVYASTRTDELAVLHWNDEQTAAFVRMQFAAQQRYYQNLYPSGAFSLVTLDEEPIGRLYVHRTAKEIRLVDIALLPAYRGDGIGTLLIATLIGESDAAGKPVRLHVEADNPASRLFTRLGFVGLGSESSVFVSMQRLPSAR